MKRIFVTIMILIALISCGISSSQRKNVNITIDEMAAYAIEVIEDSTSSWSQIRKVVNPLSDSIIALINYDGENAESYHAKGQKIGSKIFWSIYFRDSVILRSKNKRTERQYKKFMASLGNAVYSWFYSNPGVVFPASIDTDVYFTVSKNREEPVNDSLSIGVVPPGPDNPVPYICIVPPTTSAAPVSLLFFMDLDLSDIDTTNFSLDTANVVLLDEWTVNANDDTGEEYYNIYGGGDVIDKMLEFSMMAYFYFINDKVDEDDNMEMVFIPLTGFQKIWHEKVGDNGSASESENGFIKSGSVDVDISVNDYVDGLKREHEAPRIVDDPTGWHNKCIVVSTNVDYENSYDTQLFISLKESLKVGDIVKFSARMKADRGQYATFDFHGEPGAYVMPFGSAIIPTEWVEVTKTYYVEESGLRTIAFNLSDVKAGNNIYFDDIYVVCSSPENFSMSDFKSTGKDGSHEYVDLGLSVKWATVNVGAEMPYESGDYYAWGEMESKNNYSWSTYKLCRGTSYTLKKYCFIESSGSMGYTDEKKILDLEDDVANVTWGSVWRIPTADEFRELMDNTTWTWGKLNGVYGHKLTSNINGKSVFLPASGSYQDDVIFNKVLFNTDNGYYWTSSLDLSNPSNAGYYCFGVDFRDIYERERYYGRTIRAVCP
jgi:hypothetical protein